MSLARADINNISSDAKDPSLLKEVASFEYHVRKELDEWRRAVKTKTEYVLPLALKKIVSVGNPLEVEQKLLFMKWEFLFEEEQECYFGLNFLIVYFLKLQILERLFTFNKERGRETFDKVCEVHYG